MAGERALRVMFAGGGTGGHVCPAIAVANALRQLDMADGPDGARAEVFFCGTGRAVERRLLDEAGYRYAAVAPERVGGWRKLPRMAMTGASGMARALSETRSFQPDVVLGLGGYAQVPGLMAAASLGIPFALMEPNKTPGRANRLLARFAREVYVQFAGMESVFGGGVRAMRTGTPIRELALTKQSAQAARTELGLPANRSTLLIVGGSQGARALNRWAEMAFTRVRRAPISVIHLTGDSKDASRLRQVYHRAGAAAYVVPFSRHMGRLYAAADLVLCRAGGATLAETCAAGLPAYAVPYPFAVDDHQRANAEALGPAGVVVPQTELTAGLYDQLLGTLCDRVRYRSMAAAATQLGHPDAARRIAGRLCTLGGRAGLNTQAITRPKPRRRRLEKSASGATSL